MTVAVFFQKLTSATVLIAVLCLATFADTIRLKDGSIIKGRIVSFADGKFVIAVGEGKRARQMTFEAAEVDSIEFDAVTEIQSSRNSRTSDEKQKVAQAVPKSVPRVITTDGTKMPSSTTEPAPPKPVIQPVQNSEQTTANRKPVEVNVKVLADNSANGWTNSGWIVKKGQKIRVIGSGTISLGNNVSAGPGGLYDLDDADKLLKSVPTGALVAVIGDDNNEFIYIGSDRTFTATRDGALFLGINEGNLNDNSGAFDVRIEIEPI